MRSPVCNSAAPAPRLGPLAAKRVPTYRRTREGDPPALWPRAAEVADACFGALQELLAPAHGPVREAAALALRPLAPGLLGLPAAGGGRAGARRDRGGGGLRGGPAIRARVLAFAGDALRRAPCRAREGRAPMRPGWRDACPWLVCQCSVASRARLLVKCSGVRGTDGARVSYVAGGFSVWSWCSKEVWTASPVVKHAVNRLARPAGTQTAGRLRVTHFGLLPAM